MRNEYEESVTGAFADRVPSTDFPDKPAEGATIDMRRQPPEQTKAAPPAVVEEVLIEEVSIDGMCGVY